MNRSKYLAKNTLIFALGNFGTKLISFFLVPLYTSILVTAEYGVIDTVFTICSFTVPIIILNINESVMRFCLDKNADQNKIMSVGISVMGTSVITGLIFAFVARLYKPTSEYYIYIYFYAVLYGAENILLAFLRGKEKLLKYSIANIIQSLLIASLNIVFLVHFKAGVKGYFLSFIISFVLICIYAVIAGDVISVIKSFTIDKRLLKKMVKYSVVLIPNSFMWWIMNSADRVMLTSLVGVSITGVYAISNKIPQMVSVFNTIFNQAFSYSAIKEDESKDREEFNNRIFDNMLFFLMLICSFVFILIKPFLRVYVSESYYEAWQYVPPLIVGTGILALATLMSTQYTVNKDSKGFLISATIGALTNICLNFVLIPGYSAMGAAVATCISYIVVFVYRYINTQKYLKFYAFSFKHTISYIGLFAGGISVYLGNPWSVIIPGLVLAVTFVLYRNNVKDVISVIKKITKK